MQRQNLAIDGNDMTNLKQGDKIYTVEFIKEDGKPFFKSKEYEFIKYLQGVTHIEDIQLNDTSITAEIKDVNYETVTINTDIQTGFFHSIKEGEAAFVEFTRELYESAVEAANS